MVLLWGSTVCTCTCAHESIPTCFPFPPLPLVRKRGSQLAGLGSTPYVGLAPKNTAAIDLEYLLLPEN